MTLPPLPEPEASFVDGEDQYGYATYSQAYTAEQMLQAMRDTVEACAKFCEHINDTCVGAPADEFYIAEELRSLLK